MGNQFSIDLGPVIRAVNQVNDNLDVVNGNVNAVSGTVNQVDQNVRIVYDEVGKLANEFHQFIDLQIKANRLGIANSKIISIRQELEKKYGHYDKIRRHTKGILQADDLGIIRTTTLTDVTEELMLDAPDYWLAPCLVALSAWINDQPELAEKALQEAIKRDDEKTSLLFALICRRADRKDAALKWTQRYLANQDEENLDRKSVIILDAFASGLLGTDSEGVVRQQINQWMDHLSQKSGFVEQQTIQWSDAIMLKRNPMSNLSYTYLQKYSNTWPILEEIMEGAQLHATIFNYFESVFSQESSTNALKVQLDDIMKSLVTDFDDEELPLRMEEKFEQFVIEFEGDERRAKSNMAIEKTAFDTHKDFTQLLTDAAMKPESSHASVSTQKFAIALSRDWIKKAYNDVVAENRMKIPNEIEINLEKFNEKTTDGQNEAELIDKFGKLVDQEKNLALAQNVMSSFEQFCKWGGAGIGAVGVIAMIFGQVFLGLIAILAGVGMVIYHYSTIKKIETTRQNLEVQFENKRTAGNQIIRATLAEVVDYRSEFVERDGESKKVNEFLEQILPDQYIKHISDTSRKIKIAY